MWWAGAGIVMVIAALFSVAAMAAFALANFSDDADVQAVMDFSPSPQPSPLKGEGEESAAMVKCDFCGDIRPAGGPHTCADWVG